MGAKRHRETDPKRQHAVRICKAHAGDPRFTRLRFAKYARFVRCECALCTYARRVYFA